MTNEGASGVRAGRNAAEELLRESEEKFRFAFEAAYVGKSITLPSGEISVNKAFADLLGYTREELASKTWQELTPPEEIDSIQAMLQPLLDGEKDAIRIVKRYVHKDGSWVWADVSAVLRRAEDGEPLYFVTTIIDITERRRAEERHRLLEERFSSAFHGSPAGMTITRIADGRFIDVNESFLRMFEFSREEVIDHTSTELDMWSPQAREELIRTQLESGGLRAHELQARAKSGRAVSILFSSEATTLHGEPCHVTTMIDTTRRKWAEEELREKQFILAKAEAVAKMGSWRWDLNTGKLVWSDQMFHLFGVDPEGFDGDLSRVIAERIHPEDAAAVQEANRLVLEESTPSPMSYRIVLPDGTERTVWAQGELLCDEDGNATALVGYVQDITDRVRAEEERENLRAQLTQAQRMESVGRLAGGVAHDFNNMLGVILGHVELTSDKVDPDGPVRADLEEIKKAAERSADLTRQLLAFARRQTVTPKVLDVNETLERMLKMLRRVIGEDIDLAWLPGKHVWPVKVDPGQIDQILANLCVNARDAIAGVGKVTIETSNAVFDEAYCATHAGFPPGDFVVLSVSDDGAGMDKLTQASIFEPFFTTKKPGEGTGLGLATVYGIVKQNEGFINVYSEPGHGSTFKVYLPRHAGEAGEVTREATAKPPARGQETILLVEDEPAILKVSTRMLETQGYTVLPAGGAGEAISLAGTHPGKIDLLMTDVVMPEMNGRDLAAALVHSNPGLKCLFASGYTVNVIAHHGVLDEGIQFIQKPFSLNDLSAAVRRALDEE